MSKVRPVKQITLPDYFPVTQGLRIVSTLTCVIATHPDHPPIYYYDGDWHKMRVKE